MSIFLLLETICASMALGMSIMAVCILALRQDPNGIYKPLLLFFLANAYIETTSVLNPLSEFGYFQNFLQIVEIISIPAFLLLAPALWFYVRGLTAEAPIYLSRRDMKHFIPFIIGTAVCSVLILSPPSIRNQIIGDGDGPDTAWIFFITLMIVFIMIMWAAQVIGYIIALLRRISNYRTRLKDIFASTEGRELKWMVWMIVLLVLTIFIILPDIFVGFSEPISFIPSVFNVILIWFLAVWGLRQMPGFVLSGETVLLLDDRMVDSSESFAPKYEKSALTDEDMVRIAQKIDKAMRESKLHLDPNLSLKVLSKSVSVPPNYVSQTLNAHIGESFFDFINRWRIGEAKSLLSDSVETVLNITYDVGFNSRSSFYKAFKKETGQTPSAYRTQSQKQKNVSLA